jgi:hypothetical protein
MARPSRRTLWIFGGAAAAVILVSATLGTVLALEGVGIPNRSTPLPGLMTGPAPWGPNTNDLRARLDRLGQPFVPRPKSEPFVHVRISADGRRVAIPVGVGGIPRSGSVAPLFSTSGGNVEHVGRAARLGLFFKIWGLRFTKSCLGGYCGKLSVVVNGAKVPGNPKSLLLRSGQEIVVSVQR